MLGFILAALVVAVGAELTALDEYVWRPDDTYRWELIDTRYGNNATYHYIYLVSQTWYSAEWVSQPVWVHDLIVVIPDNLQFYNVVPMLIDGGSNGASLPDVNDESMLAMSLVSNTVGIVTALLRQIPNQPIVFFDDPTLKPRREDDLIAWTWNDVRLNKTTVEFLARMPMTKAAVKAMDTIEDFLAAIDPQFDVQEFYVTGASKRGWTAWTTAAVDDKRVTGFSPMVLTSLNFIDDINHHYQVMDAAYSFALIDYWRLNLTCHLNDPGISDWLDLVDPYTYLDRYTMPKLVIAATGDEFFLPDDTYFFWDQLPEPKYYNLLPNAEHTMLTQIHNVFESQRSFWYAYLTGFTLPKISWVKDYMATNARITVTTDTEPSKVTVWHAKTLSTVRRDFRWAKLNQTTDEVVPQPVMWLPSAPTYTNTTQFYAEFDNPAEGWLGFFIQMEFPGPKEGVLWDLIFTSEVMIVPNTVPAPPCDGWECCGYLV